MGRSVQVGRKHHLGKEGNKENSPHMFWRDSMGVKHQTQDKENN